MRPIRHILAPALSAVLFVTALGAAAGRADGLCTDVEALIEDARMGFPGDPARPGAAEGGGAAPLMLRGTSECRVVRQLDGNFFHCIWQHPFRAPGATTAFERINRELAACLGDRAEIQEDLGVNHPDTYDSRGYILDSARVTVSLKDKAQLQSTFVFIRIESREAR